MERIDQLLVRKGYFESRQKAKFAIENGAVFVNDKQVQKVSQKIEEESTIKVKIETLKYVSKGGLKLEKAIQVFDISLTNKICIDIGASTGGFTDCMIQNGANKVYAIDVGHGQLVDSLKRNEKVINMEGTNIKDVKEKELQDVDFISVDVSFVSLLHILPKAYELLKPKGEFVGLIKPQFEAGSKHLNKQGVVKDKKIHEKVIRNVIILANNLNFKLLGIEYSPIKGAKGNIEYLIYLQKEEKKEGLNMDQIRKEIWTVVNNTKELI